MKHPVDPQHQHPAPAGRPHPATIQDVAQLAEVSRQTVSNVLNAPERVRPVTRDRVLAAIAELGYEPNRAARSLRTQAAHQFGYHLDPTRDDALNPVMDQFLYALADAARDHQHHVLLLTAAERDPLLAYGQLVRTGAVDGFVLSGIEEEDPRVEWLTRHRMPFVTFGRTRAAGHPWVDVDSAAGTELATRHLAGRGHRRIGYLGWPPGSRVGAERQSGWRQAIRRLGLDPVEPGYAENDVAAAALATRRLLDTDQPPTALVTASDTLAFGALAAARERGAELAVVGFDDSPAARLVTPALTSVRQPLAEVGRAVVRELLTRVVDPTGAPASVLLTPILAVRDSG